MAVNGVVKLKFIANVSHVYLGHGLMLKTVQGLHCYGGIQKATVGNPEPTQLGEIAECTQLEVMDGALPEVEERQCGVLKAMQRAVGQ